jgi:hypothetical protein
MKVKNITITFTVGYVLVSLYTCRALKRKERPLKRPFGLRFSCRLPIGYVGMPDVYEDSEVMLSQFNRLIQELLRGNITRNCFRPWEIELLLDIETCNLKDGSKRETLRRYQRVVQRQMEKGAPTPMKLSEYLNSLRARRAVVMESG